MSSTESLGYSTAERNSGSRLRPSPPSLQDPMSVGKCGDADGLDGVHFTNTTVQHVCTGEHGWHSRAPPRTQGSGLQLLLPTRTPSESQDKSHLRSPKPFERSPEPIYLQEPPKLRRGLAYMEQEDGDCEPDNACGPQCSGRTVSSYCGLGDKTMEIVMPESKSDCAVVRWRLRMPRAWEFENRVQLTKPTITFSQAVVACSESGTDDDEEDDDCMDEKEKDSDEEMDENMGEHLPSGDLFHQFSKNSIRPSSNT